MGRGAQTQLAFPSNPSSVGNGEKSVAIGFGAITAATNSTAIGYGAKTYAIDNEQPHSSVAIGTSSLAGGIGSTTVGSQSGMDTHSHVNLALGWKVGNTIYGTGANVAIGSNGTGSNLFADTTNVRNQVAGESVAIGMNAGSNVNAAPTGYSHYMPGPGHSIFIGNGAGSPSTGDVNVFIGQLAGRSTVGSSNVGLGLFSGWFVKGDRNVGVGEFAGEGAIGNNNSSYGFNAGSHLTGDGNIAIGENSARNTTGNYNTAIGKGAGANTIGSDNLALGSGANMAAGTAPLTVDRAVALGQKAMAVGNDSIALGTMSVAGTTSGNVNAIAIGKGAQALGNQSISIGTGNVVTGHNSGAIGDPTYIDADSSYGIGNNNAITSAAPNAFILGNNNVVNSSNTYVLGSNVNNSATAGATPVPYGKTAENSVYLGDNSTASTASGIGTANLTRTYTAGTTTTGGLTGTVDTATVQGITYGGFAGKTSVGVVSVGAAGEERRIQNVAAGEISATSTDAINGSQLYATADKLVTTGLNFTDAAGTNIVHKDLGGTLPIIGATTQVAAGLSADAAVAGPYTAKNVQTFADKATGQIQVQMADNPVFSNVQATTLTTTGAVNVGGPLTVTGGTTLNGPLVVNNTATFNQGADMAGNKIVNVAKGTDDTDAVNVSQLNQLKTDGLNFSGNEGSTVHRDLGQTLAIRGLASAAGSYSGTNLKTVTDSATGAIQLQMADSPKFGNVTINADGSGKISGVTAGTALTDAVNVSQLTTAATGARTEVKAGTNVTSVDKSMGTAGQDIYTIHAKGATTSAGSTAVTVTPTAKADNVTDYAVDLAQSTKDDIQKGVDAKEVVDTKGLTFTGDTGTTGVKKLGETVAVTGDANITTTADASGVQVALKRDLNLDSVTLGNTSINTTGLTIVGGPSMTNLGVNAGGLKITNVANGVENNDAVNVSQLNQLKTDGLNFSGNEGSTVHRDLGQTLAIRGLASAAGSYSGTNLKTVTDSATGAIQLQMADSPKFGNVTINADGGGKITGVTAGTAATDAVNVSQLNNVQQIANKGWTLATDAGTASNVKPGDTVQLTNTDGNILISNTGNTATFNLANNLNVDSVNAGGTIINNQGLTAGNTTVTSNGLTIQGGPSVTQGGINAAGTTITNVKAGVADTDAVNVSQLKDVANVANAGWDIGNADGKVGNVAPGKRVDFVAGNTSTRVDVTQDATGTSKVTVSAAPSALQYTTTNTAAGGNTPAADPFTSTSQVTLVGPNGDTSSGVTINNVAPATLSADSKQAVNGSQLHQAGQNIANVLGGSSTYNATTNTVNAGLNVGGKTYTTVNDALQAVDLTANKGWNLQANGGTSSHIAGNDTVNVVDGKNTTVSLRDKQLQVNVVDNPTFTGEVTLQGGTTVGDHLTVQKGATVNMGGNTINNVAPGEVSATSTQAVNGSQLFAVDQKISNLGDQINGVAKDAYAGVANAIATASIPQVTMPGAKGVAVAGGTYHGQSSMAVGVSGMSDNGKWIFKGNLSTNTQGHLGAGVGALYQWR